MNRRAFLKAGASATALLIHPPGLRCQNHPNQTRDADLLEGAGGRIEKHRKRDGTILVRDASGKAVPGARVTVEQLRHEFLFGCNFFMFNRCGDPEAEEAYRRQFAAVCNYATLGFYWANYEAERGRPNYAYTDTVLEWTAAQGIACKGHPLVWDHPAGSPRWLPEDPAELMSLSAGRVREIVSRFKGRLDIWDVVNEATHLPDKMNNTRMAKWGLSLGSLPYVVEHLKVARQANPKATLLVNDYRIDPPYLRLLEQIRAQTEPLFDVVGIQSHMHDGAWTAQKTWDTCETYAKLSLPLHFTETTIVSGPRTGPGENWGETRAVDEAKQAEATPKFYTLLFSHPAVQAITWWDFSDRGAWQRAAAGWVRKDMSPKPVYDRMRTLIKGEWWTKTEGQTNGSGDFATRAFLGTYRLTAEGPNGARQTREVEWTRGGANRFELTL
jgi:GH35 family endo-1,4-beta-xylanase